MRVAFRAASLPLLITLLGVSPGHAAPCDTSGPDLVVSGLTCQLGGVHSFASVQVTGGGVIEVVPFDGTNRLSTGNLELWAASIVIGAGSQVTAMGSGYQTRQCGDGGGPADAGGAGGCALRDSGGGGAHFGRGGRGTKDCSGGGCSFPADFEEDCGNSLDVTGAFCTSTSDCRNNDALPSVAGDAFRHSIYEIEFGAAGGDKGCRDGDGFGAQPNVAGPGGGRVVLAAPSGTISIQGSVIADGRRGCGTGNDSAGGGAGGSILIAGQTVDIGAGARISARGGLGGDTQGLAGDPTGVCGAPAQQGGTCDDCGGGGGGGVINVLSVTGTLSPQAVFDVDGALGGTCGICQGEAGGGAGELQIDGAYVGEVCDGFDNDFDGAVDEGLGQLPCGIPACVGGLPQQCLPDVPACIGPVTDTRARFLVVVDTSASMLPDLDGLPSFGDGSAAHPGVDLDGNGLFDDSKLYLAKQALAAVIASYPEIDFALARYHQAQGLDQSCQLAHWLECHGLCCSYDDPRNNTPPAASPACTLDLGAAGPVPVNVTSTGEECIHYAGDCGPPERGADILVGFGADINQHLMWLDHQETNFINDNTPGDYCDFAGGGDCELRGTGPTPLAGSLDAAGAYLNPIIACDGAAACRTYAVILLTDGAESCRGDPVSAASELLATLAVETFVIGFSVDAAETAELDAIALAGSGNLRGAFFAGDQDELFNALAAIVGASITFEQCNGLDDDCDGLVDEDFPDLGQYCDDGDLGACLSTGTRQCSAAGDGTTCVITDPGQAPHTEVCNGLDDDCDGVTDDHALGVGAACGDDTGSCEQGILLCLDGELVCGGGLGPTTEICDCLDNDCDTITDEDVDCGEGVCHAEFCRCVEPCGDGEFPCPPGFVARWSGDECFCEPDLCLGVTCAEGETCRVIEGVATCVSLCEGIECAAHEICVDGTCRDNSCETLGCPAGELCVDRVCVPDPCTSVDCDEDEFCTDGHCCPSRCRPPCGDGLRCHVTECMARCESDPCAPVQCPEFQVCEDGRCVPDPCGGVSCGEGRSCCLGSCVDNPCHGLRCAEGERCDPEALCREEEPCRPAYALVGDPLRVTASGAGGCSCATGTRGLEGGWAWLLLCLLFWRRR